MDDSVRSRHQHSCPPMAIRSVTSGPWSLEWLHDHVHGDTVWFSHPVKSRRISYGVESKFLKLRWRVLWKKEKIKWFAETYCF